MPRGRETGERLDIALAAPLLVRANPAPKAALPPIQGHRFSRNGQHPDAGLINKINEHANKSILYRTKEFFRAPGITTFPLAAYGAGDRARWRFAFRTGPYCHMVKVMVGMIPQIHTSGGPGQPGKARIDLATNTAGTPAVVSAEFKHGVNPGGSTTTIAGWHGLKVLTAFLDVDPDTDYYATFYDVDYGRLLCAAAWELSSMTENHLGYLPQSLATQSHILDRYRQYPVDIFNNLLRRGGATVLNWTVDDGTAYISEIGGTWTNVVDNSSTTVSSATPGYTLDMTGKNRRSETTVPCVIKAFGVMQALGTVGGVRIVNSSGTAVASIENVWGTTASWQSTTVNLPISAGKYDLQFRRGASADPTNAFRLYAISIYELGT